MELIAHRVNATRTKPVVLIPFGCVHFDAPECDKILFQHFLQDLKLMDALTVGMGDYQDSFRTTDRAAIRKSAIDADYHKVIDRDRIRHTKELAEFIKKHCPDFEKRCMGLVEGNHFWRNFDGTSSTQDLCRLLSVRYLGDAAWIRLVIVYGGSKTAVKILVHHGYNISGSSPALSLRQMEMKVGGGGFNADIILSSHSHQRGASKLMMQDIPASGELRLLHRTYVLAKTGCFYKSYSPGCQNYASKALLRPTDMGYIKFFITPSKWERGRDLDINFQY